MIRVAVIDDHSVVLAGLKYVLSLHDDMDVIATSETADDICTFYKTQRPDVLLLDIRMPGTSGLDALATLRKQHPDVRVAMLTTSDLEEDVYRSFNLGANGYIPKDARPAEIANAIRTIAAGGNYMPEAIRRIYETRKSVKGLTEREVAILRYIAKGLSYHEIGKQYNISVNTVKIHVRHIFEKLDVSDRTEAVTLAIARGIIEG